LSSVSTLATVVREELSTLFPENIIEIDVNIEGILNLNNFNLKKRFNPQKKNKEQDLVSFKTDNITVFKL
jgi:hypothetical protein